MIAMKPFKGGNDLLWALNKAANTNKHELVVPIAIATSISDEVLKFTAVTNLGWPPVWDSTKNEMELATVPKGHAPDMKFKLATFIAFGQVHGIAHKPITDVLHKMVSVVDGILLAIEAEGRRIGLFA